MDLQRFTELADAHGAARRRWPLADQALFDHFGRTPEGTQILADAQRIDAFLDGWTLPERSADRDLHIIVTASVRTGRRRGAAWLSTGFAACAILGFALGFTQFSTDTDTDAGAYSELLPDNSVIEEFL